MMTTEQHIAALEKRVADLEAQVRLLNQRPSYPAPMPQPLLVPQAPAYPWQPPFVWTCNAPNAEAPVVPSPTQTVCIGAGG